MEEDVFSVDQKIKNCFQKEREKLPKLKASINSIKNILSSSKTPFGVNKEISDEINKFSNGVAKNNFIYYNDYLNSFNEYKKLQKKYDNINSNRLLDKYVELTSGILEEYKTILSTPSIVSKTRGIFEDKKDILKEKFYDIASKFVDIEQTITKQVSACKCGNDKVFAKDEDIVICKKCGAEVDIGMVSNSSFKDTERTNTNQSYKYEKKLHFKECVYQFQGKQNKVIDPKVIELCKKWFEDRDKPKEKITKDQIKFILTTSGDEYKKNYEDVHLIHSILTGIPCADISHLEEKLFFQFDKIVEAFLSMSDKGRVNILSAQFLLQKLLEINGYKTNFKDFPGLKTDSRVIEHKELFKKLCKKAEIPIPKTKKRQPQ